MSPFPDPDIRVDVNLRNPGQFFACCGALELASRLWPGCAAKDWREPEGWFSAKGPRAAFQIATYSGHNDPLGEIVRRLCNSSISGLSDEDRRERDDLEASLRSHRKVGQKLPEASERRRKELGSLAREGAIELGAPFDLLLDWWQVSYRDDDKSELKVWAGQQGPESILNSLREAWREILKRDHEQLTTRQLFAQCWPTSGRFGFDPSASWDALDVGFSPDEQGVLVQTSPATEILAAIGLQRCRPLALEGKRRWFAYRAWSDPLAIAVAPAAIGGAGHALRAYEFPVVMRSPQYGSFGWANPRGDNQ